MMRHRQTRKGKKKEAKEKAGETQIDSEAHTTLWF